MNHNNTRTILKNIEFIDRQRRKRETEEFKRNGADLEYVSSNYFGFGDISRENIVKITVAKLQELIGRNKNYELFEPTSWKNAKDSFQLNSSGSSVNPSTSSSFRSSPYCLAELQNEFLPLQSSTISTFPSQMDLFNNESTSSQRPQHVLTSSVFRTAAHETQQLYKKKKMYCQICFDNTKEHPERIYLSHNVKNDNGIIICPTLRAYVCPICGATGDNAHSLSYCPQNYNQIFKLSVSAIEPMPLNTKKYIKNCPICFENVKKNPERIYQSHSVTDDNGIVVCPTLRTYVCPKCGATGDNAHTLSYCLKN